LATRLAYSTVSAIEFGCGGGNGLLNAEIHISELEKLVAVKFQALWIPSDEKRPPETSIAGGRLARTPHAFSLQCLTTDAYVRFSFVGRSSDALRRGLPIEKRSDGF
jgi:hypothetical protein